MSEISIENVINISVNEGGQGVGEYNTSNLAIFTNELFESSFGSLDYKIYLEPSEVGIDFGTSSNTYAKALAVFSQQPNILANNGYLTVIPMVTEIQRVTFSLTPTVGTFVLNYGALPTAAINFNDTASAIQTKIRAVAGLSQVTVTGSFVAGFDIDFVSVYGNLALLTVSSNTLEATAVPVVVTVAQDKAGETLEEAITRTSSVVQYFGLMATTVLEEAELLTVGALLASERKIGFFGSQDENDLDPAGKFDNIRLANLSNVRCLYYGRGTVTDLFRFVAAYAGRGLSVNFSGSNTTITMHLKDLIGILPDNTIAQTELNLAQDCGADVYVSIQGVAKTFTSGANTFFDDVYNLLWFVGSLQIAGFNVLAQTGTKIAQTENGVDSLKSAYRTVCEQGLTNQFLAPGRWTSPNTFGIQSDFYDNITQRGYYIYSLPVSLQTPSDREARRAPLIQLAVKYAGAIHSSNVIVNINR